MKAADWTVRILCVLAFFALIVEPEKWGSPLLLLSFVITGAWLILLPQGVLGWLKTTHPDLDPNDTSKWWLPRLIGCGFVVMVIMIASVRWR